MRLRKKYAACEVTDPSLAELQRCGKDGISKQECEHERYCCYKDGACFYPTQEYTSIGHLHSCHTFRLTLTALDGEGHRQVTKSTFGKTRCSLSSMRPDDKPCDFQCRDGHFCVTTDNICDGIADCIDGSDELEAMCQVSVAKTTPLPISSNTQSPLNAAQQSTNDRSSNEGPNTDESYTTFLKNLVSEIFAKTNSALEPSPQKMQKTTTEVSKDKSTHKTREIKELICDFVAKNCQRTDVLFSALRQDCPKSCPSSLFSWKAENSPSLLNGVSEEQLTRLRRYLEEIVNDSEADSSDAMPGCLDKDDCALVIFPAELDVSSVQFTTDEGLAFLEPAAVAPTQAQGTNNAHVPSIDVNTGNMRPRDPDTILEVPENDSELTSFENVRNDGQAVEVPILTPQKAEVRQEGGVMASDDNNQLAAYQQVSTWQEQQRQLDDNGHQVSDQQDKQSAMYTRENTRLLTVVDPNRSSSAPALSGNDLFAGAPNPEFHQESSKKRLVSIDNLQKRGYDKSASGIDAPKEDGTSETEARNSRVYGEVDLVLKMATKNEKLQNEILGSYLMSNSKRPRNAVSKQERFSGIFGQEDGTQAGDEISTTFLSGSINTGSHDQTIIRSPTVKPISLKEWLILSGLIHELDYMDTSEVESAALDHNRNRDDVILNALELAKDESEALPLVKNQQSASVSEDLLSSLGLKQSVSENKQPTRGSGIFPETTSTPEILKSNHGEENNFLTNDDIHLLNEAIREYASSPISSDSNSLELKTKEAYLKPLNELKAFLFTQNADTSAGDGGFQEIHQNNNAEIRSSSDIKNELIINQNNAPASEAPSFKEEISSISSKSSSSPSSDSESTGASKSQFEKELPAIEQTNETNEPIEKSQSSDLWHTTESISSNIGKDEINSNLPIEASNRGDVQDEELIEHGQSRDLLYHRETLSPEKKMTSTSVLKTKPDVISPEWEHPVSHKAPTAQQNRKSEITADELSGLSRSSSQSESPAGALAALELERENTQIVKISSSVTPARSKQKPEELKNHLINALPDAVSHVQQHSSPPVTGSSLQDHKTAESHLEKTEISEQKIDERGDDANSLPFEINSPPESATYSQLAAKQQFQNAQSTSFLPSPSIVITSTKTSNDSNAENPKIPKSEPVENLTSAVKSGAYAEGSDIALLNDLRLPELLDALRTNGAYADFHKDPVKGQISSSAADESERQTILSNASKIPSSATVLNPFSAPFTELQEQPGTLNSEIVASQFTTELDPLFSQQIVSAAENTGSKYETQSASNLLSLGATQAPNSATMMSTSVNFLPSDYDASSSQSNSLFDSKTNSGDRYKVDGTQTVGRLNKLSSNNNLGAIETNRQNEPSSASSMIAELGQKGSQSEEPGFKQIIQSSSNLVNMNDDVQSAAKKTDENRVILTPENVDQPSSVPTTKPFEISTTKENNLNQGPSVQDSFSGSQIEVAQAHERFIMSKYEEMISGKTIDGSVLEENRMDAEEKQANARLQSERENHANMIPKSDVLEQSDRSFTAPVPSAEQSKSNLIQAYTNSQSHQPAFQNDLSQQQSSVLQSSSKSQPGSILNTSSSPSAADFLAVNSPIFTAEDVKFAAENSHNANLRPTAQNTVTISSAVSTNPVAYESGSSEDLTLQQNRQVNEAASPERIEGDNPLKLIQMNENWMGSSNPHTYEAAPSQNTVPTIQSELATVTPAEFENVQNLINNARENESSAIFPNSKAEVLSGQNPIYAVPGKQSLITDQVFSKEQVSVNSYSEVAEINNDSRVKILNRENPVFADPNRLGLNSKVYIGSRLQHQPVVNQNVQLQNKDLPPELAFYLNLGASVVPDSSTPNSITRPSVSHRPEKPVASEVEENVNGRMRPPLSASNVKIIPENYSQAGNPKPLVHNVNNEFNGDYNQAPQKKVPFQIFNDNLGSSYSSSNPSSSTTDQSTVGKADTSDRSSRDFFGAKVPGGSQSSQVTSALFCQSLGICFNENGSETSGRQVGMRPSSGIGQCAPQCSVVGGKTICSYRKKCMTKSIDLPSLILADALLDLLRND
ncbi:Oidioi.mRNA.OKI2018_I69.chr1.g3435.t1.cds [Oikopleura dioica]|uniref:Oidioi.mRNA.OKI2018_I69.chr1.g3435.t1.cds n=1 Tax=Oikopleura dioica TaxID=34765 RepID=A0ABN7SYE5_OIKDI|nr:Oidioi.mRNA.OKI2018_I69.chr1.g3435.t1.cds [Oikopleura dioica]